MVKLTIAFPPPELVGTSELKHRHIVETTLSLPRHASMQPRFWSIAYQTVVYLISCMPTFVLNLHSPFDKIFNKPPNYL